MSTDHQVHEERPPRTWRQGGIVVTAVIIAAILVMVVWLLR